jgi:ADP-heptose:LPS heptosyltransferase
MSPEPTAPPLRPSDQRERAGWWRRQLRHARDAAFRAVDRLLVRADGDDRRAGVAIVMPHGLGDLVLFTPTYLHLRVHYRDEPFLLICTAAAQEYAQAYLEPDRTIVVDRDRIRTDLAYRVATLRRLARARVRTIIQPGYNRVHMVEDSLVRASGADQRIGCSGSPRTITARDRARGDRWYGRLVPQPDGAVHDSTRYAAFAAALTGRAPASTLPVLARPPRPSVAPAGAYLVVAPEASSPLKQWPFRSFIETALALRRQSALSLVLVGARPHPPAPHDPAVVDLRGQTDIVTLIGLIAHARLVIGNDSAPAHLAAALAIPAIVASGGGMPMRYFPYPVSVLADGRRAPRMLAPDPAWPCFGCGWQCPYARTGEAAAPCVVETSMARVLAAAAVALSDPAPAGYPAGIAATSGRTPRRAHQSPVEAKF